MNVLTCGERIVRCLAGQPTDRIPFGIGLGWSAWGQTLERWRAETNNPELNPALELGFDKSFAVPALNSGIFPFFEEQTIEEGQDYVVVRNGHGITMRQRRDGLSMPQFLDYPVKTPADWEKLKHERLTPETPGRITEDWDMFRARLRETGATVQVGCFPFGVFGTPRDLMGLEPLAVAFYEEPAMIRDMMNHLTSLWIDLWERVAAEVSIVHIHIWEDMSGKQGSLISPAMVRSFMMPCYERVATFAKENKIPLISVDTDGNCSELVPLMIEHGVNVFFPFEVQAGNDIRDYRRKYPELGIMFGLDKRVLAASKPDIDREVEKAGEMVRLGRYIPGFDHLIPPDVPWHNFQYAAEHLREICWKT